MPLPLAAIGDRYTAQFIDGLVALALAVGAYLALDRLGAPLEWLVLPAALYFLFCDGLPGGQSLGKRLTRIAVVHAQTGLPCHYGQSFVRNASEAVLGVVDIAFIAGAQRRRLGDRMAHTKVVRLR